MQGNEALPERIWADRDDETGDKRWFNINGMGVEYVRADLSAVPHVGVSEASDALHYAAIEAARDVLPYEALVELEQDGLDRLVRAVRAALSSQQEKAAPVADTWFVDKSLPVMAMSGDVESDRVLKLHFRRRVTDADRQEVTAALNLHQASLSSPVPATSQAKADEDELRAEAFDEASTLAVPVYPSDDGRVFTGIERYRMQLVLMAAKIRSSKAKGD